MASQNGSITRGLGQGQGPATWSARVGYGREAGDARNKAQRRRVQGNSWAAYTGAQACPNGKTARGRGRRAENEAGSEAAGRSTMHVVTRARTATMTAEVVMWLEAGGERRARADPRRASGEAARLEGHRKP